MINIILVDDHHIVRQGIRTLIEIEPDIKVVGETDRQSDIINLLDSRQTVDAIIMDINMPNINGILLTKTIKQAYPAIHILVLSMMDHEKYVIQAFEAGATAYLIKNVSRDELLFAIRFATQGERYVCTEISMKLLQQAMKVPLHPQPMKKLLSR